MTIASLLKRAGYDTAMVGKWHLGFGRPDGVNWDPLLGIDYNQAIRPGPMECGFDTWFGIPHVGQLPHVYIRDHHVVGLEKLDKPIRLVLDPEKPRYATTYDKRPRDAGISPWLTFENTEPIQYEHEDLAIRLTEEAVDYLETRSPDADAPFFLYFAHRNPHVPWRPNPRFKDQSAAGDYGDFIRELDWSVGQVLDVLDRRGLADHTLVILSSDNGGMASYTQKDRAVINGHHVNGPLRGQKTQVYEGGHRVPLLARWPGHVAPGSTSDALLALTDVMATLAELTGQTLPDDAGEDSFSFLPHLLDRPATGPIRDALIQDSYRGVVAVRHGPWKLIPIQNGGGIRENPDARETDKPAGQLYNLKEDLGESNNLYDRHPDVVADLTALLTRIQRDGRSRPSAEHETP